MKHRASPGVPRIVRGVERIAIGLAATAFVFFPAVAWTLGLSPQAIENRKLSPLPDARDGWDAMDAVSPWATDHLPARANAIHANAWLDFNVLGQLPAPQQADSNGTLKAPTVVRGTDGYLFFGQDFTTACDWTPTFEKSLNSLAALAEIIHASGRRVAFSVPPNKSSVATDELPRALPRGSCATNGIERQNQLLDNLQHPLYVGVRKPLAAAHASGKQVFLRTDTHWTTLGGAMYAQALAAKLDPELAKRMRLKPERMTKVGELTRLIGLTSTESLMSEVVSSGSTVIPSPRSTAGASYQPESWVTRPGASLIPGRTLLLGDSFTAMAGLTSLRPLFAEGRFVLLKGTPNAQLISEIRSADTVVIEVAQRLLPAHLITSMGFQKEVAAALGVPMP